MGGITRRVGLGLCALTLVASGVLGACGDDDGGGDLEAYCELSAELDAQEELPSDDQLDQIEEAAPSEIEEEVARVAEAFREQGEAAFEDEQVAEAFGPIEAFEDENCSSDST